MTKKSSRSRSTSRNLGSNTPRRSSRSCKTLRRSRSLSKRKNSRSLLKKRSHSTRRHKFKVAEEERRHTSSREVEPDPDSTVTKSGGEVCTHFPQRSQKRKYDRGSVDTSVEEIKPRKRIGLISQDCPGFQDPHARLWSTIDKQELSRILIDIRREVQQPRPMAKVERELGDPSLFVVPRDQRQPLASRVEFKGASKPWQKVSVVVNPMEGWEERLIGSQEKAAPEMLMSCRPEFRGAEKGWQQIVVVAKPIKEWEEKLEESLRRKVEMVVVVKPIKKWDDKYVHTVNEEKGPRWRFKTGGPEVERTKDKRRRKRKRRG